MLGVFMNTGNDITFVIQGPINTFCIKKSIDKIRTLFQNAKIIVSSFYGADTSGLLADSIILSDDPGCFYYSKKQKVRAWLSFSAIPSGSVAARVVSASTSAGTACPP